MLDDYQPKPRALWLAALIFCAAVIADSWFRWSTYQYASSHLAFYVHSFWLTLQGQSQSTLMDASLMGNHAEPITYLLLPLFWILKHPMVFVIIQALLVATMPFTGYRIARRMEFDRRGALWLGLATLLAPATGFMVLNEFHAETLAAPLLLLMLEARLSQRTGLFWLWFLLAVACNENVAVLLAWFCAVHYLLERKRGREWQMVFNLVPAVVAAVWVAVYAIWLKPMWSSAPADPEGLYSHLGGWSGILKSPGTAIAAGSAALMKGNLVWGLIVPFLLLPILRPKWLIIALPIFAQHLLAGNPSEWSINFHHAAPVLPLLWFATAEACARLFWRDMMAGWIVATCIVFQLWIGPARAIFGTVTSASTALEKSRIRAELIDAIPDDVPVLAGFPYLSHLAMREQVYSLHRVLKRGEAVRSGKAVPVAAAVLIDVADKGTFDPHSGIYHPAKGNGEAAESEQLLDSYLAQGSWRKIARNEVALLLHEPKSVALPAVEGGRVLDGFHRLIGIKLTPPAAGDAALAELTFEIQPKRPLVPWLQLHLQAADGRRFVITKGPIGLGEPTGVPVTESWAIRPSSAIPAGKYRGIALFYDNHETFFPGKARFEKRTFDLGEIEVR